MKKHANKKLFFVDHDVFGDSFSTLVCVGMSSDDILKYIRTKTKKKLSENEVDAIKGVDGVRGRALRLEDNETLLFLKEPPSDTETIGTLAHEAFHIADFILGTIGVTYNDSSDEMWAYLTQHVVVSVLKHYRK